MLSMFTCAPNMAKLGDISSYPTCTHDLQALAHVILLEVKKKRAWKKAGLPEIQKYVLKSKLHA